MLVHPMHAFGKMKTASMLTLPSLLLLCLCSAGQFFSNDLVKGRGQLCTSNQDCDDRLGEICWHRYEGCHRGQCACNPRTHFINQANGKCIKAKRLKDSCQAEDQCADLLQCVNGTCSCPYHNLDLPCILPHYKFIGSRCNPSSDICYHESAYSGFSLSEAECPAESGFCQCKEGYKLDVRTCRRLHIGETGCKRDYHCEGGSVCIDERCSCPTGYKPVARNTKCAKSGAILELPVKVRCDEINEKSYCSYGLICHRCHENENHFICARYLRVTRSDHYGLSSRAMTSSGQPPSLYSRIIFVVAILIINNTILRSSRCRSHSQTSLIS